MRTLLLSLSILLVSFNAPAQSVVEPAADSLPVTHFHCGPPPVVGVFMMEAIVAGMSWYASKPNAWGDKVVGVQFGGGAAFMLGYIPFVWAGKSYSGYPEQRVATTILCAGMAYGYSRVAYYNLAQAENATSSQRFWRNMLEMNLAIGVPFATAWATNHFIQKRKDKKTQIGFMLAPNHVSIGMTF